MRTVYTDDHRKQDGAKEMSEGELVPCFEMPQRADIVLDRVNKENLGEIVPPISHGLSPVLRVHDKAMIDFLSTAWDRWTEDGRTCDILPESTVGARMRRDRIPEAIDAQVGYFVFDVATPITVGTWDAAQASANVALTALDIVLEGERASFALCRPPGHHAAADFMGGYCFLNNVAIAAQSALDKGNRRVAILDVDYHHGNGTQDIFYQRNDVLFVSLHGHPSSEYPFYLGYEDEVGDGLGHDFNVNFPLHPGTGAEEWFKALQDGIKRIEEFQPDVLLVSLGVDTFKDDPISKFTLDNQDFVTMGQKIAQLGLPTVFVMEGGYAVDDIGVNTVNVLKGFEKI